MITLLNSDVSYNLTRFEKFSADGEIFIFRPGVSIKFELIAIFLIDEKHFSETFVNLSNTSPHSSYLITFVTRKGIAIGYWSQLD